MPSWRLIVSQDFVASQLSDAIQFFIDIPAAVHFAVESSVGTVL